MIAQLGGLDNGLVEPVAYHVRSDDPLDSFLDGTGGYLATENKPAVVVVHAPVVQLQFGALRFNRVFIIGVIGVGDKAFADGIRLSNNIIGDDGAVFVAMSFQLIHIGFGVRVEMTDTVVVGSFCKGRTVRLTGKYTALGIHNPWLAEQGAGEEFKVEAYLADKLLRNGTV
ncbi:hypothetical protein Barb6_03768 [Bacteroidales bacterium Barb6]|nr:hypothetical protein Barb6_03768 [Bacteroidales bacterium Barb6]